MLFHYPVSYELFYTFSMFVNLVSCHYTFLMFTRIQKICKISGDAQHKQKITGVVISLDLGVIFMNKVHGKFAVVTL